MLMRAPLAGRKGRRGQAAVLIALSIFAMLLLLAMATNVGIVVNDKIRMQTTADAAVYAAAYSEAASLNELVELNKGIVDAVKQCRTVLAVPFPETTPCGCRADSIYGERAVDTCEMWINAAIGRFVARAPYNRTVGKAINAGKATAEANFPNSKVHFFEDFFGSPTFPTTFNLVVGFNGPGATSYTIPSVADFRQVTDTKLNYRVIVTCPMPPSGQCTPVPPMLGPTTDVKTWFYKETKDPDVWVAGRVSGTPENQYLDTAYRSGGSDGGYFGGSSTSGNDKIYAYAVAKPYDGSMGPSNISGNTRNGNGSQILGVYSPGGTTYPKLTMFDDYRARLAGVNENLAGSRTPAELIQMDGLLEGKYWDMSKFKH